MVTTTDSEGDPEDMRAEAVPRRDPTSAPWTIWAYGISQLGGLAASLLAYEIDIAGRVGSILVDLVIFVGLLKGARLAWIVAMFFQGIGVLGSVGLILRTIEGEGENSFLVAIWISFVLLGLIALLHPRTRAWTRPQ